METVVREPLERRRCHRRSEDRRRAAFASSRRTIFTDLRVRDASVSGGCEAAFLFRAEASRAVVSHPIGRSLVRCARSEFLLICTRVPGDRLLLGGVGSKRKGNMANNQEEKTRTSLPLGLDRANPSFSLLKSFRIFSRMIHLVSSIYIYFVSLTCFDPWELKYCVKHFRVGMQVMYIFLITKPGSITRAQFFPSVTKLSYFSCGKLVPRMSWM